MRSSVSKAISPWNFTEESCRAQDENLLLTVTLLGVAPVSTSVFLLFCMGSSRNSGDRNHDFDISGTSLCLLVSYFRYNVWPEGGGLVTVDQCLLRTRVRRTFQRPLL